MVPTRSNGFFNDFTNALSQQLYFFGRDVSFSGGNLLIKYGFEKKRSHGKQSTSCYQIDYQGDTIELHGLCVGLYPKLGPGFVFTRYPHRCWLYHGEGTPAPGMIDKQHLSCRYNHELDTLSRKFLSWLLEYENWIAKNTPSSYRKDCYDFYRGLPKSKVWLTPELGLDWLIKYHNHSPKIVRAKEYKRIHSIKINKAELSLSA